MTDGNPRVTHITDSIIERGFLLLIVATPLLFGSVYVWAFSLFELVAAVIFAAWLIQTYAVGKRQVEGVPNKRLFFPVFLFFLLVLLQLFPLPLERLATLSPNTESLYRLCFSDLDEVLDSDPAGSQEAGLAPQRPADQHPPPPGGTESGPSADPNARPSRLSLSIAPHATRQESLLLLSYFALFYVFINYRSSSGSIRPFLRKIIVTICISSCIVAFLGFLHKGLNLNRIYGFWSPLHQPARQIMGPYVNANHFAGYMELTLPIVFFLFASWLRTMWSRGQTRYSDLLHDERSYKTALATVGILLLLLSLLLSASRAGIVSFLVASLLGGGLFLSLNRFRGPDHRLPSGRGVLLLVSFLALTCLFALLVSHAMKSASEAPSGEIARFKVWKDTFRMFRDYPLWGVGLGCFSWLFPRYKTVQSGLAFTHAENDYLQLLAETGIFGLLFMLGFFLLLFYEMFRLLKWRVRDAAANVIEPTGGRRKNPGTGQPRRYDKGSSSQRRHPRYLPTTNYFLFLGCLTSIVSLLLHSLADFNLHIPANAFLFFLVLGLSYRLLRLRKRVFSFSRKRRLP